MRAPTDSPIRERVKLVVPAAFRHFPGCCPRPVEVGEPMARLAPTGRYVHEGCAEQECAS